MTLKTRTIAVGTEIPELVKHPTTRQLVQYAGASGDFYEMHYDQEQARSLGLPGVIIHGLLKAAFLGELVTAWCREWGQVEELEVSYRGMDMPGVPLRCRGRVARLDGSDIGLEIWTEDPSGAKTTLGSAIVRSRQ
jgi:acyl dehydratase